MSGKAVLISIRPEWCEKILNGEKTIEIRKTRPKLDTPFKGYIYSTKPSRSKMWRAGEHMCFNDDELYRDTKGKIKYGCSIELMACDDYSADNFLNGKVIGEFSCDRIDDISLTDEGYDFDVPKMTCLRYEELEAYLDRKKGYGWHISDLKIYDEPKPLSAFRLWNRPECAYGDLGFATPKSCDGCNNPPCHVQRAPQSWCYVEELEG